MKTHTLPALLLLVGCHDFEGELGQIGFSSNLILRPGQPWTPDHPIAAENPVEIAAMSLLNHDTDAPPEVEASVSERLISLDPESGHIAFTGAAGDAGRVHFWGEATDRFSVRFSEPRSAVLFPLLSDDPIDTLLIQDGGVATLATVINDLWGVPQGYDPALLSFTGCGAEHDPSGILTLSTDTDCTLEVSLDSLPLLSTSVTLVPADAIDQLELTAEHTETESGRALQVSARAWTADGMEVYGLQPDWSASGGTIHWAESNQALLLLEGNETGGILHAAVGEQEWSFSAAQLRQPETTSISRTP
jgi:hypothetical protein